MLRNKVIAVSCVVLMGAAAPVPSRAGYWEETFGRRPSNAEGSGFFFGSAGPRSPDRFFGPGAERRRAHAPAGHVARYAARTPAVGSSWNLTAPQKDDTLRPGDAVVGRDGVKVYLGETAEGDSFASLDERDKISARLRARLSAYFSPYAPRGPGRRGKSGEQRLAFAASSKSPGGVSTDQPAIERVITDAAGKRIRMVGGSLPQWGPPQADGPRPGAPDAH